MSFTGNQLARIEKEARKVAGFSKADALAVLRRMGVVDSKGKFIEAYRSVDRKKPSKAQKKVP